MCASLKKNGRIIPWNSLKLDLTCCKKGKCAASFQDGKCFDELGDERKIKHLEIEWYKNGTKCRVWKELPRQKHLGLSTSFSGTAKTHVPVRTTYNVLLSYVHRRYVCRGFGRPVAVLIWSAALPSQL